MTSQLMPFAGEFLGSGHRFLQIAAIGDDAGIRAGPADSRTLDRYREITLGRNLTFVIVKRRMLEDDDRIGILKALHNMPRASATVAGATTLMPGMWAYQFRGYANAGPPVAARHRSPYG